MKLFITVNARGTGEEKNKTRSKQKSSKKIQTEREGEKNLS